MPRFPRKISGLLAVSALAAGITGGIAAIPVSASATGAVAKPDASWIAGEFFSLGSCELAGENGVWDGDWKEYICIADLKNGMYFLNVTDG
jgi:hypothetical protein